MYFPGKFFKHVYKLDSPRSEFGEPYFSKLPADDPAELREVLESHVSFDSFLFQIKLTTKPTSRNSDSSPAFFSSYSHNKQATSVNGDNREMEVIVYKPQEMLACSYIHSPQLGKATFFCDISMQF